MNKINWKMDLVPNRFAIYSQPSSEFISSDSQTLLYLASLQWLVDTRHSIVLYFDRNKASSIYSFKNHPLEGEVP